MSESPSAPDGLEFLQKLSRETRPSAEAKKDPSKSEFFKEIDSRAQSPSYKKMDPLQRYNLILGIIHLILAVFLFVYFRRLQNQNKENPVQGINLDLFDHVFTIITDPDTNENVLKVISEKVRNVKESDVTNLIVTFCAITAAAHFFYALNPGNVYLDAVNNGNNYFRFFEYAISATIMIVIIGLLSGTKSLNTIILFAISSVCIMFTGQIFEAEKDWRKRWIPLIIGFVLLMGTFGVIIRNFRKRLQEAEREGAEIPGWLYGVVFVLFGFYSIFGLVPVAQQLFPKYNYRKVETTYLSLSLLAKTSLVALVASGFSQRSQSDEEIN